MLDAFSTHYPQRFFCNPQQIRVFGGDSEVLRLLQHFFLRRLVIQVGIFLQKDVSAVHEAILGTCQRVFVSLRGFIPSHSHEATNCGVHLGESGDPSIPILRLKRIRPPETSPSLTLQQKPPFKENQSPSRTERRMHSLQPHPNHAPFDTFTFCAEAVVGERINRTPWAKRPRSDLIG